jgi:hydrogenase maturation protease
MSSEADVFLEDLSHPGPQEIAVAGCLLRPGSRVRLRPRPGGDVLDGVLAGRAAMIEGIEQDDRGTAHVAVILDDDPGRDLAATCHPTRRFLFMTDEIEPIDEGAAPSVAGRVLVAGIGNVFFGDDGFGSAVARRLAATELPPGIEVADFGIRGLDLAYALGQPYDAAILVDAMIRGGLPGRLWVIEPAARRDEAEAVLFDSHRMDPLAVLHLARRLGGLPPQVLLVGCEPLAVVAGESMSMGLSIPVAVAVEKAVEMVLDLAGLLLAGRRPVAAVNTEGQHQAIKEP